MSSLKPSGLKAPSKIAKPGTVAVAAKPSALTTATPLKPVEKAASAPVSETSEGFVDDFRVGERVWVNGNKPGFIQFLGETQFAPGQWAGIVLDEAIGKNDGAVAGVRYFQCEALRGIFTRPSKLSRKPLEDETNGAQNTSRATSPTSVSSSNVVSPVPSSVATPLKSTTSSTKESSTPAPLSNLTRTASESISNLSETGSIKKGERELKLGDRVLVSGSKAGVIRFLGETDFAKGEWCGVELDEPLGKNDGAVAGTRYFQCQSKYGLFAPVHKVTRIGFPSTTPAKAKTTVRKVPATPATPSSLKRSPSASSISSMSSISSSVSNKPSRTGLLTETSSRYARKISGTTALQEALKEKQQHIEQLLAERDMERAEVAKATSHVGEVEQELSVIRDGHDQYVMEMESKMDQLRAMVEAADREKVELLNQLEEEKRKVEDLQFRVEEESITKGDLETQTKLEHARIKELEQSLLFEKTKADKLQRELEDTRAKTRPVSLKVATVSEKSRIMELEKDLTLKSKEVADLHQKLAECSKQPSDVDTSLSLLQEISSLQETIAALNKKHEQEIESLKGKVDSAHDHDREVETLKARVEKLSKENETLNVKLSHAEKENAEVIELWKSKLDSAISSHQQAIKELTLSFNKGTLTDNAALIELKAQIENLKLEQQKNTEQLVSKQEADLAERLKEIEVLKAQLKAYNEEKEFELEAVQSKLEAAEEQHLIEMEDALNKLHDTETKVKELEALQAKCREQNENIDSLKIRLKEAEERLLNLDTMQKAESELKVEILKFKQKLETAEGQVKNLEAEKLSESRKANELKKDLLEHSEKIAALENNVKSLVQVKETYEKEIEDLKKSINSSTEETKILQKAMQETANKLNEKEHQCIEFTKRLEHLEPQCAVLEKKVKEGDEKQENLLKTKAKLENQIEEMIQSSGDSSVQLSVLNEELQSRERSLADLQAELSKSRETVKQLQVEIEQLKSEAKLSSMKAQESHQLAIKAITSEMEDLKLTVEKVQSKNREMQALHEKSIADLVCQHEAAISELKQNLQAKEDLWKTAQTTHNDMVKQMEELQQQAKQAKSLTYVLESKKQEVELITEEMRVLKVEKDMLAQEADALKLGKDSLLSKIVECESCINVLQQEQTQLLSLNEELKAAKDSLTCEKQDLEQKCTELNNASQTLAADKEQLITELGNAKEELLKMSLECEGLQSSVTEMDAKIKELQTEKDLLFSNCVELQKKNQEIQEHQVRANEENLVLAREKDEMIHMLKNTIEDLMSKQKALEKDINDLEAGKQFASDQYLELQSKFSAISDEKEKLLKTITDAKSEMEDLLIKQNQLNTETENVLQEKERLALKHCSIETELMEVKSQLDKSIQENLDLAKIRDELLQACAMNEKDKHKLEEYEKKVTDQNLSIKEKDEIIEILTCSKEDLERKETDLIYEISTIKKENESMLNKNLEYENKVSVLSIQNEVLVRTNTALTSEREELTLQQNELNEKVKELLKEKDEMVIHCSELTKQLSLIRKELDCSEKDNEELQLAKKSLTMLLEEIKTSSSISDSERVTLLHEKEMLLSSERKLTNEIADLLKHNNELVVKCEMCSEEAKSIQGKMMDEINNLKNEKNLISLQLADLESQLGSLSEEQNAIKSVNTELQSREQLIMNELANVKTKYECSESSNLVLSQEKSHLLEEIELLKVNITEAMKKVDELTKTNESLSLLVAQTQKDKTTLELDHQNNLTEKQFLLEKYDKCCLDRDLLTKDRDDLQEKFNHLHIDFTKFEQRLAEEREMFKSETDCLQLKCTELQTSLGNVMEEKEQLLLQSKEHQCKYDELLEQKVNIDNLLHTLAQEKVRLELQNSNLSSNLEELNNDFVSLTKSKEELQDLYKSASNTLEELRSQHEVNKKEMEKLHQERSRLLSAQENLESANVTIVKEKQDVIETCGRLSDEVVALTKSNHEVSGLVEQLEIQCQALQREKEELVLRFNALQTQQNSTEAQILEVSQIAEESHKKIEQITAEKNALLKEKTESVSAMEELQKLHKELQKELDCLKEQQASAAEQISKTSSLLKGECMKTEALKKELEELRQAAEHKSQQLAALQEENLKLAEELGRSKEEVSTNQKLEEERSVLNNQLLEMKKREHILKTEFDEEKTSLQKSLTTTSALITEKDRELERLRKEVTLLRGENESARTLQLAVKSLESEKLKLEQKVQNLEKELIENKTQLNNLSNSSGDASFSSQSQEDGASMKSQIDFLNSVIVDLQRKNDDLKEKIDKMVEESLNVNNMDEMENYDSLNGTQGKKKVPPRLFCDICDCFDLHDTEDCPTQAQLPDLPHSNFHGNRKEERPYCDICEVFGHWTNSCNDDETF